MLAAWLPVASRVPSFATQSDLSDGRQGVLLDDVEMGPITGKFSSRGNVWVVTVQHGQRRSKAVVHTGMMCNSVAVACAHARAHCMHSVACVPLQDVSRFHVTTWQLMENGIPCRSLSPVSFQDSSVCVVVWAQVTHVRTEAE